VQHCHDADLGAEVAWISGNGAQRLSRRSKQDVIDGRLVLECDRGDRRGYGEDNMKILHWQQLGLPIGYPGGARQSLAFRAMTVAAGIIGNAVWASRSAVA
jgi:hypothetical protein